jgi:hypothetical protein
MIAEILCKDCHRPKRTRKGLYCQRCNALINGNKNPKAYAIWMPEEVVALQLIFQYQKKIADLKAKVRKNHSYQSYNTKFANVKKHVNRGYKKY